MSTLSSANVTDVNLVLKERTHMRRCLNMLIFTHNLGNWLIIMSIFYVKLLTDRQTDKHRPKHNVLGGDKNIKRTTLQLSWIVKHH